MSAEALESALRALVDPSVSVAVASLDDQRNSASDAELAVLGSVVAKREREFVAGRSAARRALSGIGFPATDILIGTHRQALAPRGAVLSISHDHLDALAVAARDAQWLGIGVDIGDADELPANLIDTVCCDGDLADLLVGETLGERAKLVFCLKEALFKAIYPQVQGWMEFSQSQLLIDHQCGAFAARICDVDGSEWPLQGQWFGRFVQWQGRWLAAAGMRREGL